MKTIKLTKGQEAIVDDWWFDYLNQWKWFANWSGITHSYYAVRKENGKNIHMHRVIARTPDGMLCDHIHHNTLDNRECELRNVTRSQSCMNRGCQKSNKLGILGISATKFNTYRAILDLDGKHILDKTFKTIEEAVAERKKAEEKYFGEYSYSA